MNRDLMLSLVGKVVKIDRGGPESRVGMLLAVDGDYFVLFTKDDGVVYYKMQHVKSITLHAKGSLDKGFEGNENMGYYQGEDFKSVISNFRHSWVKVNRGGPESLEGILNEVEDDYVTIFSKEEVIQLSMFHIRNISFGVKEESQEEGQEAQSQEAKSSTNTKSSGNRRK
ncbi:hypothetical protein [Solibacillus isronensis]|uniref:hypothetical protein n=1 Tax=Solibacillus isronensis TaxID=412383 RepID=UPI00203E27F4|nr:hypothetical protein [Solibacillus isronensis]MCM3723863.1 hypothetical protein [Solibacillus isronensis]